MIFDYVTLGTADPVRAGAFYDATMATLGIVRIYADEREVGYGRPDGEPEFWINLPFDGRSAAPGNGVMPAFAAPSIEAVHAFHAAALAHGGQDEGAPGPRPHYGEGFYACYVRDPDGNRLSAVHRAG